MTRYYNGRSSISGPASVAVSPVGGRVFVTGTTTGPTTSRTDYATVGYSAATGAQLWVKRYNGPTNCWEIATSVAASANSVFVTGRSSGIGQDYATVAYDAGTGARKWVARYNNGPGKAYDYARSVAVSPTGGKVFVTGYSFRVSGDEDYATVGYDGVTGAQLWVSRYNGPASSNDEANSVAVSPPVGRCLSPGSAVGPPRAQTTPPSPTAADLGPRAGVPGWRPSYRCPAALPRRLLVITPRFSHVGARACFPGVHAGPEHSSGRTRVLVVSWGCGGRTGSATRSAARRARVGTGADHRVVGAV